MTLQHIPSYALISKAPSNREGEDDPGQPPIILRFFGCVWHRRLACE